MNMNQMMIDTEPEDLRLTREALEQFYIDEAKKKAEQDELRKQIEKKKKPVIIGHLLKSSRYSVKQERMFVLFNSGRLLYYTQQQQSDELELIPGVHAEKLSPKKFLLKTKTREFKLTQIENPSDKKHSREEKNYSCMVDHWVDAINGVVDLLTAVKESMYEPRLPRPSF